MFRAARKDANHKDIVNLFRRLGWAVLDVSQLKNCCDLVVSKGGQTICIEIKDGTKPPSDRKLTEGEAKFQSEWKGRYQIVCSEDDVLNINKRHT